MNDPTIRMIMVRVKPGGRPSCFEMYACRELGAQCEGHIRRSKPCVSCVKTSRDETLGDLYDRMHRHNA